MKWLLITTTARTKDHLGTNVGDEFAKIGIQRLISQVDPKAAYDILDKEDPNAWNERPFDKAVLCGMPLFWSLPSHEWPCLHNCSNMWWWPRIFRGWPSKVREHFLVMGVGHVYVDRIVSILDYTASILEVLNRSWKVVVRGPIFDHPNIVDSICPSAFAIFDKGKEPKNNFCNFMPKGGHFGYLTPDGEAWDKDQARQISDLLKERDFTFVAHTKKEWELAQHLGWPKERVTLFHTAQEYLDLYCTTRRYFGNRIHAGAVCAALGRAVWAATHDSRLSMVTRLGGKATRTTAVSPEAVKEWLSTPYDQLKSVSLYPISKEFERMKKLMADFSTTLAKPPWTE